MQRIKKTIFKKMSLGQPESDIAKTRGLFTESLVTKNFVAVEAGLQRLVANEIDVDTLKVNGEIISSGGSSGGSSTITLKSPDLQFITTPGSGTYTPPAGALYLQVKLGGGGAGGQALPIPGDSAEPPGNGGDTTFSDGTSTVTAGGGLGGGNGGTWNTTGYQAFGFDGNTQFQQPLGAFSTIGFQNKGAGGNAATGAVGGGAGAIAEAIIPSPLRTTYSYTVGARGSAGICVPPNAGDDGAPGYAGYLIIQAFFQ